MVTDLFISVSLFGNFTTDSLVMRDAKGFVKFYNEIAQQKIIYVCNVIVMSDLFSRYSITLLTFKQF